MSDVDGQDGQDIVTNDDETEESLLQGAENDDEIGGDGGNETSEDPEIEAIKRKMKEMEEEAEMLKEMHSEVEKHLNSSGPMTTEEKKDVDGRSIYVGNVDYSATAQELESHFHGCGSINRVTILCDRYTGHPKGYAYIEFADKDSVETAKAVDESLFKGRQIKVYPKRTNLPGMSCTDRPPRGRGYRGRGYGRGFSRRPRFRRGYYHYSPY